MADIGSLSFSVHLQDMTDADAARIKKKLENLSVNLNIDGNNIKVSNTDIIKKQLEDAVKSVNVSSVKVNVDAVKQQIEGATQNLVPQVKVTLLKDNLSTDIQSYLDTKSFNVKISITKTEANNALKNLGNVAVPVTLKVNKKVALDGLKQSLLNMTVPIGVRLKSSKDLAKDIQERMKNTSVKVGIDANRNVLRSNVTQALRGQTFKANLDLVVQKASVQQAIRQAFAQVGLNYNTSTSDVRQNLIDTRNLRTDAYVRAQKALEDYRRAQIGSAQAANQQNSAMERVNRTAERQKGLMAGIREQVANMYALYRIGRFLDGVIRISGEFQQQHVALQTILGDAEKADVLFQRIKGLAVESPFKFGDLTKYAKQLAAFSIPYEEMFDTLKRFGDLSAGLGIEMGRIILAYGQVRSAEFLKGTELRQFTEAGIPLVTELAKRYTELEGTLVSVGDVYDRISKKEVPFTDVKAVLWDLTNEGGRFFEMQAVLTDTLKGKLDKLIDSYEIFLSEVGNSNNEILGNSLDLLTDALSHWELIQNAIMGAVSAYGTYKATLIAVAAVQKTTMAVDGVMKLIKSIQFLRNTTLSAAAAQVMWNKVSAINPWVALATVLATVAGSFFLFKENAESAAEANARLNAELEKERDTIENTKNKAEDLVSVMRNEKNTIDSRKNAYSELQNIYPSLFKNMSYEQAMLLKEIELRGMVADAAKRETREKIEASLVEARQKLSDAQTKEGKVQKQYDYAVSQGVFIDKWEKELKKAKEETADFQNSVYNLEESLALLNKKEADLSEQRKSRWYTESKKIAEEAGLKSLIPTDKETDVWEYFDRIKQGMDDIKKRKDLLDPKSVNYSTMLGNLDTELEAYQKIYYGVLGGKNEEVIKAAEEARKKREKQLQDEAKQNEKAGKEAAKAFADGVKSEMERITSQWDLYKQLFDLTGDKQFASTAFTVTPVWDEAAEQMLEEMKRALESQGLDTTVEFNISDNVAKAFYGNLYDSWKQIKDRIEKNGIDLKINTGNAIKDAMSIQEQIETETNKKWEALIPLQEDTPEYTATAEKFDKIISDLKAQLFALSPAFTNLFVDTTGLARTEVQSLYERTKKLVALVRNGQENRNKDNIVTSYSFTDESGKVQEISIEKFKELLKLLEDIEGKSKKLETPLTRIWDAVRGKGKLGEGEKKGTLEGALEDMSALSEATAKASDELSSMFDSLGNEDLADAFSFAGDMLNGVTMLGKAAASFASGDILGGIYGSISGVTGIIGSIAAMHDKKLDKAIKKSQLEVQKLENAYSNLESHIERQLGSVMGYQSREMLDNLIKQRSELQKQYEAEDDKKKTDKSKLEDYNQQISELGEQIRYFYEDLANEQYGVDIKDWAGKIAEALTGAFASGEDAAKAFDNTVGDILQSLATEAIRLQFIEPAMSNLRNYMFGQNGIFTNNSEMGTDLSANEAVGIAKELDKLKGQIEASNEFWDKINDAVGGILDDTENAGKDGLSKGIQSVTEDTDNLLASYVNSIRQSVHVKQQLIEKLVSDDIPKMNYLAEAQLRELSQIQSNTARNVALVGEIRDLVNRVVDKGSNKLKI